VAFFAFVAFFPQLVAGPIERASNLLPQFLADRHFDRGRASDGLRQILWGLFKKIVIADNCAPLVNQIFDAPGNWSGSTLALGAVLFAFQIYCDFSGYSDIAIGTSRLFGIHLTRNFAFPYFSRDIAEFWRRWHITLSTWFRDYVYIPLGGSRGGTWAKVRNTFIVFAVSGFWHGANWTFVIWGLLNALYFMPLLLLSRNRANLDTVAPGRRLPSLRDVSAIAVTFAFTCFAWIFFRAESVPHAMQYLSGLVSPNLLSVPEILPKTLLILIGFLVVMEWSARGAQHALAGWVARLHMPSRWLFYTVMLGVIWYHGNFLGGIDFIYFQF
jgi:D-alanyl-lipoteichoic acid acyltransferase DltB (MBOAT superfamily)